MILDISIHDLAKMTFEDAIKNTKYGDTIIYHVGQYAGGKHKYAALEAAEKVLSHWCKNVKAKACSSISRNDLKSAQVDFLP